MKTAYFDLVSGASGDMLLGALVDAGLPIGQLEDELRKLHLDDFRLSSEKVLKNCFSATKVDVHVSDHAPERYLADLQKVVTESHLSDSVKEKANRIFHRICEAEAAIHNSEVDKVHLHEVGGVDAIVDVCGVLAGLEALGIERVIVSPFPLGRGFVFGAHGEIPLPAPAALSLLKGCPIVGSPIDKELVTPTGAAILSEVADGYGPIPPMTLDSIGYGAGTANFKYPNVLRLILGESEQRFGLITETLVQLESNLDDESPEIVGHVSRLLMDQGALDVALLPAQMKKDRPGVQIQILAKPAHADRLQDILLSQTTTLGVRRSEVRRDSLPRRNETIETEHGPIRVKVAQVPGQAAKVIPEYEDCSAAAEKSGLPLGELYYRVRHEAAHALNLPHDHEPFL
ncbi:nickel pincer cofactor biosynthesis protein LarC [Roseibacillus persicicus]|uniref:nickel pincer cofactor biosynthesis protein LarC n=1 Tax=Roseibacillus persicicus TaxID=454148 RepID=UPI00280E8CAA|nr:nickel pincer cofactor biosynthesis protein LarC [Roseibacillus persicicus]MDQ8191415.1 nickel pincer cofactor biosynthesis protein LarC [Roseibacillus persicicus]